MIPVLVPQSEVSQVVVSVPDMSLLRRPREAAHSTNRVRLKKRDKMGDTPVQQLRQDVKAWLMMVRNAVIRSWEYRMLVIIQTFI